jgi:CRP-like cAMP-binding protein
MIASLRRFISTFTDIPETDWEAIEASFRQERYNKNQLIVLEGEICRNVWFVEKGLFRWYFNKDGEEITKFFSAAPGMLTAKYSFHRQEPSLESIMALTDATMWRISFEEYQSLLRIPAWNAFVRLYTIRINEHLDQLLHEIRSETAEKRYFDLLERHKEYMNDIPLQYIASYLGIAPQSLSRIRKKIDTGIF